MIQAITLCSIFNIPSEILGLILEDVYTEVNKTFGILMTVSKSLMKKIVPALGYIRRSVITNYRLAKHLSGLTELFIADDDEDNICVDGVVNLPHLNKNIWGNLEILRIPYRIISQLNENEFLDKFVECNTDEYVETSSLLVDQNLFPYKMGKLHTLSIAEFIDNEGGYYINPSVIPDISKMMFRRCVISNLSEFTNLQYLKLNYCRIDTSVVEMINGMNLKSLVIQCSIKHGNTVQISAISLRTLKIERFDKHTVLDISGCSNLESLNISDTGKVLFGRMVNLHKLVLGLSKFVPKIVTDNSQELGSINELLPSVRSLNVTRCPHIRIKSVNESKNGESYLRYMLEFI